MDARTNLRVLKRSRPRLRPGDIFAMSPSEGQFLFGRVILADLPRGQAPMPTANLIYIYGVEAGAPAPVPLASLVPTDLIVPPQFVNRTPWTTGLFQSVTHKPLEAADLLQQHCFWDSVRKVYRNETGTHLARRFEPCGVWGLGSSRLLDDLVSDALGIQRAPE